MSSIDPLIYHISFPITYFKVIREALFNIYLKYFSQQLFVCGVIYNSVNKLLFFGKMFRVETHNCVAKCCAFNCIIKTAFCLQQRRMVTSQAVQSFV